MCEAARDPVAEGKAAGVAFEEAIAELFAYIGFDATRIGGSGNTDVIVRWKDKTGTQRTAILDAKSKFSGFVSHSDISDVALETHKEKHNAEYVAVVGPGFSGDTIKNHAKKEKIVLITDNELCEIAKNAEEYGLLLSEIALLFDDSRGLALLEDIISSKQRESSLISAVASQFISEQEAMDALSPRDMLLLLKDSDLSPTLEELIGIFDHLSNPEIGLLHIVAKNSSPQYVTYILSDSRKVITRLRAFAKAIETGVSQ